MIVVTAAGGRTGAAVVRTLWSRGERVRALVGGSRSYPGLAALSAVRPGYERLPPTTARTCSPRDQSARTTAAPVRPPAAVTTITPVPQQ